MTAEKPNIVFFHVDNLGMGELGCYGGGILRGADTRRIDTFATEGAKLTHYVVEPQCTPTRSALMTGRYPIRSGNHTIALGGNAGGLVRWEQTIAEILSKAGYVSSCLGKWHIGAEDGRWPTDHGFDEWYGPLRTYDECMWLEDPHYVPERDGYSFMHEGRKGEGVHPIPSQQLTLEMKKTCDLEYQKRAIDFSFYREERPVHRERVAGFWIDPHPVTNADFGQFVAATGHVTMAERAPDPAAYPDADPALLVPGSLVFRKTAGPVSLRDYRSWWEYVPGACWRHPEGPGSTLEERESHPVVHVAYEDACAYAVWAGRELPSETEWEFAARGGLEGATYAWGSEAMPGGRAMANTWQGNFPWQNLMEDGYEGTSPVRAFPANGYGLYDMIGNVWEWTASPYDPFGSESPKQSCCVPSLPGKELVRMTVKGGSHLCAPNYCLRYRPAARQGEPSDTSTCHIGFRCIDRAADRPFLSA